MKSEVKNTKRFWRRGNVLDVAIVLLILAALVTIGYRYYQTEVAMDEEKMSEYHVAFSVESTLPSVAESLKLDDAVYFADGAQMGKLVRHSTASVTHVVVVSPATTVVQDDEGNYVNVMITDGSRVDVLGTVSCHATVNDRGTVLINGEVAVTPGQKLTVHTELATLVITVTSVTAK